MFFQLAIVSYTRGQRLRNNVCISPTSKKVVFPGITDRFTEVVVLLKHGHITNHRIQSKLLELL